VHDQFGSWKGFLATVKATFSSYRDPEALRLLSEPVKPVHAPAGLVQLTTTEREKVEA
jgi:hypothetical protein